MWPDWAKFFHLFKISQVFVYFGDFLKFLGANFLTKVTQLFWQLTRRLRKASVFKNKLLWHLIGQLLEKFRLFFIPTSGPTAYKLTYLLFVGSTDRRIGFLPNFDEKVFFFSFRFRPNAKLYSAKWKRENLICLKSIRFLLHNWKINSPLFFSFFRSLNLPRVRAASFVRPPAKA